MGFPINTHDLVKELLGRGESYLLLKHNGLNVSVLAAIAFIVGRGSSCLLIVKVFKFDELRSTILPSRANLLTAAAFVREVPLLLQEEVLLSIPNNLDGCPLDSLFVAFLDLAESLEDLRLDALDLSACQLSLVSSPVPHRSQVVHLSLVAHPSTDTFHGARILRLGIRSSF